MFIKEFENVEVSYYNTLMTSTGRTTSLAEFLAKDFSREVLAMRFAPTEAKRTRAKRLLPAVTISGVFEPERRLENFIGPYPTELTEWDKICYLSRSASGKGLFAIVKLKWPLRHKSHFYSLEKEFARRDFVIDKACSDVTRLRCATYDPMPHYNPVATAYDGLADSGQAGISLNFRPGHQGVEAGIVTRLVKHAISARRIILDDYDEWIRIGYALASLGEDGRELFHLLSATSSKYSQTECDKKFTAILRTSRGEVSIGTLFRILT